MSRPYLDKIVTSAHIPQQPGQTGYCSRVLIPDLSCCGIKSALEPQTIPVTTSDGRITEIFKRTAYSTMLDIERGITTLNAKEEIFKLDHRQYIDKLLVDMEDSKTDKHKRRMRHWKKKKEEIGFPNNFELTPGGQWPKSTDSLPDERGVALIPDIPVEDSITFPEVAGIPPPELDEGALTSESMNSFTRQIYEDKPTSPQEATRPSGRAVRIDERVNTGSTHNTSTSRSPSRGDLLNSRGSAYTNPSRRGSFGGGLQVNTGGLGGDSGGGSLTGSPSGKNRIRAHSRMALFNTLLEVVPPPHTAIRRFGSMGSVNSSPVHRLGASGSSRQLTYTNGMMTPGGANGSAVASGNNSHGGSLEGSSRGFGGLASTGATGKAGAGGSSYNFDRGDSQRSLQLGESMRGMSVKSVSYKSDFDGNSHSEKN